MEHKPHQKHMNEEIKEKIRDLLKAGKPTIEIALTTGYAVATITRFAKSEGIALQKNKYKRINYNDRIMIQQMLEENIHIEEVALIIGVNRATLYRELERGGKPYNANVAHFQVDGEVLEQIKIP